MRIAGLAVLPCAVQAFAAWAQSDQAIRVATTPIDLGAEALYAEDLGFFRKAGLNVQLSILANGNVVAGGFRWFGDIGQANVVALATAHANGIPFMIVAPAGSCGTGSDYGDDRGRERADSQRAATSTVKTIAVSALKDLNWSAFNLANA